MLRSAPIEPSSCVPCGPHCAIVDCAYSAIPPEDYGKPRPVVVVQSDAFAARDSVTMCLLTATLINAPLFRARLGPGAQNSLRKASDIMVDKILTLKRSRLTDTMCAINVEELVSLDRALASWLGLPST